MLKSIVSLMFVTSSMVASDGVVNVNKQTGTYTVGDSKVKGASSEMKGIYPPPSPKGMNGIIPRDLK